METSVEYSVTVPGGKALKSSSRVFFAGDIEFHRTKALINSRATTRRTRPWKARHTHYRIETSC